MIILHEYTAAIQLMHPGFSEKDLRVSLGRGFEPGRGTTYQVSMFFRKTWVHKWNGHGVSETVHFVLKMHGFITIEQS